eukprot:14998623-Alexandrium_andersonii.AAC.1
MPSAWRAASLASASWPSCRPDCCPSPSSFADALRATSTGAGERAATACAPPAGWARATAWCRSSTPAARSLAGRSWRTPCAQQLPSRGWTLAHPSPGVLRRRARVRPRPFGRA